MRCIKFKYVSPITKAVIFGYVAYFNHSYLFSAGHSVINHYTIKSTNGVIYNMEDCELLPEYKSFNEEDLPKYLIQ